MKIKIWINSHTLFNQEKRRLSQIGHCCWHHHALGELTSVEVVPRPHLLSFFDRCKNIIMGIIASSLQRIYFHQRRRSYEDLHAWSIAAFVLIRLDVFYGLGAWDWFQRNSWIIDSPVQCFPTFSQMTLNFWTISVFRYFSIDISRNKFQTFLSMQANICRTFPRRHYIV